MGVWEAITLIIKYFPMVVELVKKLNDQTEKAVIDLRVNKAKNTVEVIFSSDKTPQEKAKELNDVFRK